MTISFEQGKKKGDRGSPKVKPMFFERVPLQGREIESKDSFVLMEKSTGTLFGKSEYLVGN